MYRILSSFCLAESVHLPKFWTHLQMRAGNNSAGRRWGGGRGGSGAAALR